MYKLNPHRIKYERCDHMAKKDENYSLWERSEYDVISETETETEKIGVIRVRHSGAVVICHIPKHTPEEEQKISSDIAYAMTKIMHPNEDIDHFTKMTILKD